LQGEWKGVGLDLDFPQSWTVILDVENNQFGVRYPTMDCSGEWKILHHNHHRATFIEVIWQGRDNCTNNGKIVVTYIDQYHILVKRASSKPPLRSSIPLTAIRLGHNFVIRFYY